MNKPSEIFTPLPDDVADKAPSDYNDLAVIKGNGAVLSQVNAVIEEARAAELATWPEPLLDGSQPPELQASLLPRWLGEYAAALCDALQVPPAMVVVQALATMGAVAQRRYVVQVKEGYTESMSLWGITAAPSGSRKTSVRDALIEPLEAWERNADKALRREIASVNARRGTSAATIKRLELQAGKTDDTAERGILERRIQDEIDNMPEQLFLPRAFVGDVTVERLQSVLGEQGGRMSVLTDEGGLFSSLSATYNGGVGPALDVLLQGYTGSGVRVERASRQVYIDRAAVSLGLLLQPGTLASAASSDRFRDSGLLARFVFAIPPNFVGGRDVRRFKAVSPELRQAYHAGIDSLMPGFHDGPHLVPKVLRLTPQALDAWFDFAQAIENRMGDGGDLVPMIDWAAKLAGQAARIAGIFALVQGGADAREIDADNVAMACKLCELLIPHARAAFAILGADPVERDAAVVLDWIVRQGPSEGHLHSVIHKALHGRFTKKERLQAALRRLQEKNCIRSATRKKEGVRPATVWVPNPRLFV